MSFLGKEYKFVNQENYEELIKALELNDEHAKGFLNYKPNQMLVKDGDFYSFVIITPDSKKELKFKLGEEFDENIAGRHCKTVFTLDGNILTQVQKFDDNVEFRFKREFSDNEMVATVTTSKWNGVARRYYKA